MYFRFRFYLASLVLLTGFLSCGPRQDRAAEVQKAVDNEVRDRLATFRDIHQKRCREDIEKEAGRQADSVLLATARQGGDSIYHLQRPPRPEKPDLRPLIDTSPVQPIRPRDTLRQ